MRGRAGLGWTLAVTAAALLALSCGADKVADGDGPRGIVLISVDELRRDRLAPYGGSFEVASLAGDGVSGRWYDDVAGVTPTPRAAATTLLSGLTPPRHGVFDDVLDDYEQGPALSVPERLQAAGWRTAAFVQSPLLGYGSGYEDRFEVFDAPPLEVFGPGAYYPIARPGSEGLDNLDRWLGTLGAGDRWFAWVQIADLYGVAAGTPFREDPGAAYDAAVPKVVEAIDRIVAALAARTEPVDLIVVGPYGTRLEANAKPRGSAFWLNEETLSVPLFVGRVGGEAISDGTPDVLPRWLPDVAATVLDLAGVGFDGIEGIPLARTPGERARTAWTWATWNRVGWPALSSRSEGGSWSAAAPDDAMPVRRYEVSPERRAALRDLGIALGERNDVEPLQDPAQRDEFLVRTELARFGLGNNLQRRTARQDRWFREAVPDQLAALHLRMFVALIFEDAGMARPLVDELYARFPERPETLHWGAHAELLDGKRERAKALLAAAEEAGIEDGDVEYDLACIAALEGDVDEALARLDRAVDRGFRLWRWIERDPDLTNVRSDPRYAAFMAEHR